MSHPIHISGFTIVRNALILDYPFEESVRSVLPLCDEFVINCGDSEDETLAVCENLQREYPEKIRILRSEWKKENQSGGYQLKAQTDHAIQNCRGQWLFYIQADEAIHEADYAKILAAKERAEKIPEVDGVVFDYLHFYGNFSCQVQGRNWYRREVRLFKAGRGIESFKDAQGFRKAGKRLLAVPSQARVFHYGYVRAPKSLKVKSAHMAQWWGKEAPEKEEAFQLVNHIGITEFRGTHPAVMATRVSKNPEYPDPRTCPRRWNKDEFKNAITFLWESIIPYRIGEYRNYDFF